MFVVYILYSEKLNRYYVGTTDDIKRRFAEHNLLENKNSYTSRGVPWQLYFLIEELKSDQAYKIERHIKSMHSSKFIQNLKKYPEMVEKLKLNFS